MSIIDESSNCLEESSNENILGSSASTNDSDASDEIIDESVETVTDSSRDSSKVAIKAYQRRRRLNVLESSDEEDDNEEDERAISPRTRMSITGVRPDDMSDDDDINFEEYEQQTEKKSNSGKQTPTSLGEGRSAILYSSSNPDGVLLDADSSKEQTLIDQNLNSPAAPRYTTIFAADVSEKLSSTFMEKKDDNKNKSIKETNHSSSDDDVEIMASKNETIEISSSDEDAPPKIIEANKLLQPKIDFAMPKPVVSSARKSKTATGTVKYVSEEFYNKEFKKMEEIKSDLRNSERVLKQCGKSLPDQGRQLQMRINGLQRDLEIKSKLISTLKIETNSQGLQQKAKEEKFQEQAALKVPDWNELSAAVNAIQPKYTGKQGLATFNTQRSMTIETLKSLHSSLEGSPGENVLADAPDGLKVTLMDHQRHALAWMAWREKQKPSGGILADDMGLGKTLTTIAMVLAGKQRGENVYEDKENDSSDDELTKSKDNWTRKGNHKYYNGPTLVVCPASLIRQWEDEVNNKLKRNLLTVCVHHGSNRETKPRHLLNYDIVVTTYQLVSREHKSRGALFGIKWLRVILDEAHIVRNHKAACSEAVCALRAKNRWALTGTPIQNKEMDVYALLKFLQCKPFNDLATWKLWIEKHTGGKERLHTILKTIMLRRTKTLLQNAGALACLPQKHLEVIEVNLDKDEMNVYQNVLVISRSLFAQFLTQHAERQTEMGYRGISNLPTQDQSKAPNDAYYKLHEKFVKLHKVKEVKSAEILVLLLRLRQICCHPSLIHAMLEENDAENLNSDEEHDESVFNLLDEINKLTINESDALLDNSSENQQMSKAAQKIMKLSNPVFDENRPSTKMHAILKILQEKVLSKNDKAIVISQWTTYLDIFRRYLESNGIKTLSLNGQIPVKQRQDIVNEFNKSGNDKQILLLSLTAGGVGLNLVGANHLLLTDLHWNPQLEAQAQDRIYRVGQKKNVNIYKFMCLKTVEERIKALQDRKLEVACNVLTGIKSTAGSKLTIDDLKSLFDM